MKKLVPIRIPPGAYRNGTEYQAKGRYRDVNLVRWHEGALRPVGGWVRTAAVKQNVKASSPFTTVRGMMAWTDNSGGDHVIMGGVSNVWVLESDGTLVDIEGTLASGQSNQSGSTKATTWSFSTFGEIPIGCSDADGQLLEWDLNVANNMTAVSGAPTGNTGVHVTAERFVFALGAGGDPKRIEWSDRGVRTTWTSAATNQAGGFDLDTEGDILFAMQLRGETVIVCEDSCWQARYVGYPDVYTFDRVGRCTAAGLRCGVSIGDQAFWLGENSFYTYQGGYVQTLPCDVWDYFTGDISAYNWSKVYAWHNSEFNEVWWLYTTLTTVDSYIAFNYLNGTWHYGRQPFTAVVDKASVTRGSLQEATPLGMIDPVHSLNITNSSFSSDSFWEKGTNWQITGGSASQTTPTASTLHQVMTGGNALHDGQVYYLEFTVTGELAGGTIVPYLSDAALATQNPMSDWDGVAVTATGDGTWVGVLVAPADADRLEFVADGVWDGQITVATLRRVLLLNLETGLSHESDAPYAETGPIELGDGEQRVHVTKIYPDEQDAAELTYTFTTREYPTAAETAHTAVVAANPTSIRFSGRQFTMKVAPTTAATDWRCGVQRLKVTPGGKR